MSRTSGVVRAFRFSAAIVLTSAILGACSGAVHAPASGEPGPIDGNATPETRALFFNLRALARSHVLFGHQDDLAYGHDWVAEPGRSDVRDVSGSYPAVYGWELSGLESSSPKNIDGVDFERMRGWIAEGYRRGGVITLSWHVNNPLTGKNAWDTTSAVFAVLPGGAKHEEFKKSLDKLADFLGGLRGPGRSSGSATTPIPVIFRPWHEMSGGWFWWGVPHTKGDEFQRLWQYTVTYLRDVKGLHNLLYAYAPNAGGSPGTTPYMLGYPGDDYVDVLGYDYYFRNGPERPEQLAAVTHDLAWVVRQAESRGKIPALTESGLTGLRDSTFFTKRLAAAIEGDSLSRRLAYVMVWRNANRATRTDEHIHAPYAGHPGAEDFRRFKADPLFLFEDALPDLYRSTSR